MVDQMTNVKKQQDNRKVTQLTGGWLGRLVGAFFSCIG